MDIVFDVKKVKQKVLTPKPPPLDVHRIRLDFPMLQRTMDGMPLIYLDNAATSQKPRAMIECLTQLFSESYGKPNEKHGLSEGMTKAYEEARETVALFINAPAPRDVVFTRGCTASLSGLAGSFEKTILGPGDEVMVTQLEHHSSIVPWQLACARVGARLRVIPITKAGELDMAALKTMLSPHVKALSISHVSNALGSILPIREVCSLAHEHGIPVIVDGAQGLPHLPVDVQALNCDFYVASGHKAGGPPGSGFIYGRTEWMERLEPYEGGSEMAQKVRFGMPPEFADLPLKFEAGDMPFTDEIALAVALRYWNGLGMEQVAEYEKELLMYATALLSRIPGVQIFGTAADKVSVLAFTVAGCDPADVEKKLWSEHRIAVRSGHQSAQPLMQFLGVPGLVRASFLFYNTHEEVDRLAKAVAGLAA